MCKTVPPIVENLEEERQRKIARTRESRQTLGRCKKFKRESGTDRYYGPQAQKSDVIPDVLGASRLTTLILTTVPIDHVEIDHVEIDHVNIDHVAFNHDPD